ncbi:MAG: hypothetical protein U0Q14_08890 [Dermatophilaceae bacterium]
MFEPAPLDPREVHEFVDSPRHPASIVSGWVLAGLLGVGGLVTLLIGAAPSTGLVPAGILASTADGLEVLALTLPDPASRLDFFLFANEKDIAYSRRPHPPRAWTATARSATRQTRAGGRVATSQLSFALQEPSPSDCP